jgi:hypothetical protein
MLSGMRYGGAASGEKALPFGLLSSGVSSFTSL